MTRRSLGLFTVCAVLWGLPYLLIKIALADLAPAALAFTRVALAASLLAPVFISKAARTTIRARWRPIAALAAVEIAVPFYLIARGERAVSSSLTALLLAACPLAVAVLAYALDRRERIGWGRAVGLLVGFAGVALLVGLDIGSDRAGIAGALMILGATASYAIAALLVKRWLADAPPLTVTAGMLGVAALMLAPAGIAALPAHLPAAPTLAAIAALAACCTTVAFVAYYALIAEAGAARATVITYVNPAIAVALGVAFLGEPLHGSTVAGLLLVLAGSWLSTGGTLPPGALRPLYARCRRPGEQNA